jgi:hypothetical protein
LNQSYRIGKVPRKHFLALFHTVAQICREYKIWA